MSVQDGIQLSIQAEDEFSEAFNSAQESLNNFSNSVSEFSSTEQGFANSTNEVIDQTNNLAETQGQASESTNQLQEATESSSEAFSSGMSSIMGVSGAMTMAVGSSFALGDAYMRQQDATIKLQNAQENLSKQQQIVEQDQEKLQYAQDKLTTLQESGKATAQQLAAAQQAVTAASDTLGNAQMSLANAQNNVVAAQNRSQMANEQLDMTLLQTATMTIPTLLSKAPEILGFLGLWETEEGTLTASQLAQSAATGIASGAMTVFDAVMDANPIALVVIAIGGLVAALAYLTDGFKNFGPLEADFNQAWKDLQTVFNDVVNFIKSDVYPVLDELYKIYVEPIISAINTIEGIGKSIGGAVSSIVKSIPGLAEGGIVDQPTLAMIGEQGPEAIIPLASTTLTAPTGFRELPQINATTTNNTTSSTRDVRISIQQTNQISSSVNVNNMSQELANKIALRLEQGY